MTLRDALDYQDAVLDEMSLLIDEDGVVLNDEDAVAKCYDYPLGGRPGGRGGLPEGDEFWGWSEWWRTSYEGRRRYAECDIDETDEEGNDLLALPDVVRLDSVDGDDPPGRHPTEADVPEEFTAQASEDMEYEMSRRSRRTKKAQQEAGNWGTLRGADGSSLRVRGQHVGPFFVHDNLVGNGFTLTHTLSGSSLATRKEKSVLLGLAQRLETLAVVDWKFSDLQKVEEGPRQMVRNYCFNYLGSIEGSQD